MKAPNMKTSTMQLEIKIDNYAVLCTLVSGFEGGINYWCRGITGYAKLAHCCALPTPRPANYEFVEGEQFAQWLASGAEVLVNEEEAHAPNQATTAFILNGASIAPGLRVMAQVAPYQFGQLLSNRGDANTGDCLIQCCLWPDEILKNGRCIYG